MWLAPVIILGIALCIVGLIFAVGWLIVPGLLVVLAALALHFAVFRSSGDATGRAETSPRAPSERERPEDTPGGPREAVRGPAHEGQRHMTP